MMEESVVKGVIETLLFINEGPLSLDQIKTAFDETLDEKYILQCIEALKKEYNETARGLRIVEVAGGYQLVTAAEYSPFLKKFYKQKYTERLRPAALETLAIIAYRQPVTRSDAEAIRGVSVDGVIKNLMDKGLIRIVGRKKNAPGRPFLYGTTKIFLERFGLNSLNDLPKIEEFGSLEQVKAVQPSQQQEADSDISKEADDAVKDTAQADK